MTDSVMKPGFETLSLQSLNEVLRILDKAQSSLNKRGFYNAASKVSDVRIAAREEHYAFGEKK